MTDQEFEEKLVSYLKENLWIDTVSDEVYVGDMSNGGSMYKTCYKLKIYLNQDVITEAYLG